MRVIYFDICAIPLFLMILFICFARRMIRGNANQLFIAVVLLSLLSAVADLGMESPQNTLPLSEAEYVICTVSTYIYLIFRNATNAVLLLFLLHLTRTSFLIRKYWVKVAFSFPYAFILGALALNPLTHAAFTITRESGYSRGPLMFVFYGIALLYGIVGLAYCIYCRRYMPTNKWIPLMSVYVLGHLAVLIQFFRPEILVEMFCTALGEMLIMLCIMRPEERMDSEVGMLSWASYRSDLRNILLSGERVQIIVIRLLNCLEIRHYLGDQKYYACLSALARGIRAIRWKQPHRIELYFERPGSVYLITDSDDTVTESGGQKLLSVISEEIWRGADAGVRFDAKTCLIHRPDQLQGAEEIISLGHIFQKFDKHNRPVVSADEIVRSESFVVESRIGEILDRAIRENRIEMYYQPIYDVSAGRFRSAEALARIIDPDYGFISPAVFIPAAEAQGYILSLGDAVLEQVFRFLSEHDPDELGIAYVEINLSVAQCMQRSLPEKMRSLQQKYGVDPGRINLEITETTFENISDVMLENFAELIRMGYSFALDDYGTGYSNIQRVNNLPLKLIKIDKSMLDECASENGRKILTYTVRMMQSIGKQLVAEGAETREMVELLKGMGCDYIQGYYFSRPLPADSFIRFMEEHKS